MISINGRAYYPETQITKAGIVSLMIETDHSGFVHICNFIKIRGFQKVTIDNQEMSVKSGLFKWMIENDKYLMRLPLVIEDEAAKPGPFEVVGRIIGYDVLVFSRLDRLLNILESKGALTKSEAEGIRADDAEFYHAAYIEFCKVRNREDFER